MSDDEEDLDPGHEEEEQQLQSLPQSSRRRLLIGGNEDAQQPVQQLPESSPRRLLVGVGSDTVSGAAVQDGPDLQEFKNAGQAVMEQRDGLGLGASTLLIIYALYCQGLHGDCPPGSAPHPDQHVERQKWNTWSSLHGMSPAEARKEFMHLAKEHGVTW
eukprot:gnl/TRDRNA2_/TRDRNA2_30166_c0_seq2.p1 gnl/TRDRNA2_/TRDRNA2_30166_c0~~gnl/TRDRNA2_/TRDRNA2_30166_c0_seq2.p1  ORF type:complete len:187 (-),score=34.78 gnl/TRDRNA2_/TRDRNA2_30166_c0_seq2:313-789(-)